MASDPFAGIVSGAIGGIASLFGADSESRNVKRTNEMNYKIAQETNQMSRDIARENNAAQLDALKYNNEFNRQQAIDMFNLEAEYNSPSAQKERLLAAGLNPATMYGSGSASVGNVDASTPSAASSGISPSMPSLVTPTMQTPPSVINSMFGNIESFARSVEHLASSKLSSAKKNEIETLLDANLQNILSQSENAKANAEFTKVQIAFEKLFGYASRDADIKNKLSQAYRNTQEGLLASIKGDTERADQKIKQAQFDLEKINIAKGNKELEFLGDTLKGNLRLILESIDTEKSKQVANYGAANQANTQAEVNKQQKKLVSYEAMFTHEQAWQLYQMRRDNISANHWKAEDLYYTYFKDKTNLWNVIRHAELENDISKEKAAMLKEMLRKVQNENDFYEMVTIINATSKLLGGLSGYSYPLVYDKDEDE